MLQAVRERRVTPAVRCHCTFARMATIKGRTATSDNAKEVENPRPSYTAHECVPRENTLAIFTEVNL